VTKEEIRNALEIAGLEPRDYDIALADFSMRLQKCDCLDQILHYAEISENEFVKAVIGNLAVTLAMKWGIFRGSVN
jgi:hypothetical protein